MTDQWIAADMIFDGTALLVDRAVRVSDGIVTEIGQAPPSALNVEGLIAPGFVDLQVNGGGGVMLNSMPTAQGVAKIAAAHRQFGTTALLPTVITDEAGVLMAAANAVIECRGANGVLGLHIEGPHISKSRRGTHSAKHVRKMEQPTLQLVRRLRERDLAVMITLATEAVDLAHISELSATGAVVSLGHTDASAIEMAKAIEAGASCGTHLFNAMSPMTGREPGAVGTLLASECYAGIICDGHHVDDRMVGIAVRSRPVPDRTFLVSDAMATVGGPNKFELYGETITLREGRLINREGSLAGAHATQLSGVTRLANSVKLPLVEALKMATTVPANCIGHPELGQLVGRKASEVIHLGPDMSFCGTVDRFMSPHEASVAAD